MRLLKSLVLLASGALFVMGLSSPAGAVTVVPSDGHHESVAPTAAGPCTGAANAQVNTQPPGPLGTSGAAYMNCGVATISMEVTVSFYQDGILIDKATGTCVMQPPGAGCGASTDTFSNPAGSQRWCATAVFSVTGFDPPPGITDCGTW